MRSPVIKPGLTPFSSLLHAKSPSRTLDVPNSINGRILNLDDNDGESLPSKKFKPNNVRKILEIAQESDDLIRRRNNSSLKFFIYCSFSKKSFKST